VSSVPASLGCCVADQGPAGAGRRADPIVAEWFHRIKRDGFRILAPRDAAGIRLLNEHLGVRATGSVINVTGVTAI